VPTAALPPVRPLTCQVTAVLVVLLTATVIACVPIPAWTFALAGDTDTVMGAVIVTVAEADRVGSEAETAVTVTLAGDGTLAGAV
jgi:hypothetical protein